MNVMQPLAECADDLKPVERTIHWRDYFSHLNLRWGESHAVIVHESPHHEVPCHLVVRLLAFQNMGCAGYELLVLGANGPFSISASGLLSFKQLCEAEVLFFAELQLSAAALARRPRPAKARRMTPRLRTTSPLY